MIRRFKASDENACRKIIRECFDDSVILNRKAKTYIKELYTKKGYLAEKNRKYEIYVYAERKKILGMGSLQEKYIGKVYVDPKMHGKGIGKAIMNFLEDKAREKGHKKVILHAYRNSRRFYSKMGYKFRKMYTYNLNGIKVPTYEMEKKLKIHQKDSSLSGI